MLEHTSKIAVAVSGGKDSLTLLHILNEIEKESHGSPLIAITVDEGIKGYRDEAIGIIENACKSLDIPWILVSFKELFGTTMDEIAKHDRQLGACSYCGVLRRRALNEAARRAYCDRLATGHNLDDMAQSALLNLLRGDTGRMTTLSPNVENISGFVQRIKPICEVPEAETTLYAYLSGFQFQSMSCPYSEEAMRNDIRHFLTDMEFKRPGTLYTIYNTALKLMPNISGKLSKSCRRCGELSTGDLCRVCQLIKAYK